MGKGFDRTPDTQSIKRVVLFRSAPIALVQRTLRVILDRFPEASIDVVAQANIKDSLIESFRMEGRVKSVYWYSHDFFKFPQILPLLFKIRLGRYDAAALVFNNIPGDGYLHLRLFVWLCKVPYILTYRPNEEFEIGKRSLRFIIPNGLRLDPIKLLPFLNSQVLYTALMAILKKKRTRLQSVPVLVRGDVEKERISVLQINTSDVSGGASKVAWRLQEGLRSKGHKVSMIVKEKASSDPDVCTFRSCIDAVFLKVCTKMGLQYWNCLSSFDIPRLDAFKTADILHLHNLHGEYFNPFALPGLTRLKPTIWTLHDMHPLTGHCAHAFECERWERGCDRCPNLTTYPPIKVDATRRNWVTKRRLYKRSSIHIVVPSMWLWEKVKRSILKEKELHLIYHGVDTDVFRPHPRLEMRRRLKIPLDCIVLITSARWGMIDSYKGLPSLLDALREWHLRANVVMINIGGERKYQTEVSSGISFLNTGYIYDEAELARWYSIGDLFLLPSIAENCPLSVLEAMACGVPVVAFKTGAIPELVKHMETGYIAKYGDFRDLLRGVEYFLGDGERIREASGRAREAVLKDFTIDRMIRSYLELYRWVEKEWRERSSKRRDE